MSKKLKILKIVDPPNTKKKALHPNLPQPPSLVLMIMPTKTGKCLYEYSLVETEEGNKYIKNVKVGDKVLSDSGFVEVDKVFKQGKKKSFRIISENGYELILTEDHKLHTIDGMKAMRECDNEMIITKTGMTKIKSKEYYGEVECYDISVKNKNHRFFCNFFSVSNSTIISNMLLNKDFYGQDFFDETTMISTTINNDQTSRFMKQAFNTYDYYSDTLIQDIVRRQSQYDKEDMPSMCLVCDDCLGEKTTALNNLASRYRHYNIDLFIVSSQLLKKVSPTIRANANWVLVGRLTNEAEVEKLSEEWSGMFGGDKNFREMYKRATKKKFDFMTLKLTENPAEIWINFNEKIYPTGPSEEEVSSEDEE